MKFIELEEAWQRIEKQVHEIEKVEYVDLANAIHRKAADNYCASMNNPPFDRSPLDGYACRSEDMKDNVSLKVIDKIYAGMMSDQIVGKNECVRLMTGAPIPQGADCVIKQEETSEENGFMTFTKPMKHLQNIVFEGEDIKKGELVLEKGTVITKMHTCVLASVGISQVQVYKNINASIITTGDEVAQPEEKRERAQIYDSTSTYIKASLVQQGVEMKHHFCSLDSEEKLKAYILEAIKDSELIITTGGVSVGEKDLLEKVMIDLGAEILFHGVAMKPGSPVMVSLLNDKVILSLSGNPFAALATWELIGRACLAALSSLYEKPEFIDAINLGAYDKVRNHAAYVRACWHDGKVEIPNANHSSGSIRSMIGCNALVYIPKGEKLEENQLVKVLKIDE